MKNYLSVFSLSLCFDFLRTRTQHTPQSNPAVQRDQNLKSKIACLSLILSISLLQAQNVAINADNIPPHPSAILDISSANKGVLFPRVTSLERTLIQDPAHGLLVFDISTNSFWVYSDNWKEIGGGSFTLPYTPTVSDPQQLFSITNTFNGFGHIASIVGRRQAGSNFPLSFSTGIWGDASVGTGILGTSNTHAGVYGKSQQDHGVYGQSEGGNGFAGVYGKRGSSGIIPGFSMGIWGDNANGPGVAGTSQSGAGLHGHSNESHGVYGYSGMATNAGVKGYHATAGGIGVMGHIEASGVAVYGKADAGNAIAGKFESTNPGNASPTVSVLNNSAGMGLDIYISGSSESNVYGIHLHNAGNSSGGKYGIKNQLTNTSDGDRYGISNELSGSGNGSLHGTYNYLSGSGDGARYGARNMLFGNATGQQYGIYNSIATINDNIHFGMYSNMNAPGNGTRFGTFNNMTGSGTGWQVGTRNQVINTGNGPHTGILNTLSGIGSGEHIGMRNDLEGAGTGTQIAVLNIISSSSNLTHYGTVNNLWGAGNSVHYGSRNILSGPGTGHKYAVYGSTANAGGNNNYAGYFDGDITVTGTFFNPSDQKLKTNIVQPRGSSSLEKLRQVNIYQYEYNRSQYPFMALPDEPQTGMLAQELQVVFPELVQKHVHPEYIPTDDKDPRQASPEVEYLGINYIGLIPHLVSAMQEQQEIIEALKEEISQLRDKVESSD